MSVIGYLDCGCAILSDGGREYCPACAAKIEGSYKYTSTIKLPGPDSKEYQKLGEIIRDYYVQQCGNPEWVLPVFQHTDKVLAILKEKER